MTDIYTQVTSVKYFSAMYHAVLMLGSNEMGPTTTFEGAFISCVLVLCIIVNSNIFGEMAVLVQMMGKKSAKFQSIMDSANTTMKNLKISKSIQDEIRDYFRFT